MRVFRRRSNGRSLDCGASFPKLDPAGCRDFKVARSAHTTFRHVPAASRLPARGRSDAHGPELRRSLPSGEGGDR